MKLFTKEILKALPLLGSTGNKKATDIKVPLKLFNACGSQTWYIAEYDAEKNLAFGFVNLGDDYNAELGYISITELENIDLPKHRFMLERDRHWDMNITLEQVIKFEKR